MIKTDFLKWFPQGRLQSNPNANENEVAIPISSNQWLLLKKSSLTQREQELISLLLEKESAFDGGPWYDYLVHNRGKMPQNVQKIQFVHCHLFHYENETIGSWLEMMRTILPNRIADFQLSSQDYIFVLDQTRLVPVKDVLRDTLSAIEYDFSLTLTIQIGQIWPLIFEESYSELFQAEHTLFVKWWKQVQHSNVYSFSQLFLWGIGQKDFILPILTKKLHQLIESQDQLVDIIAALWENTAVVTKAAQQLYIHRNTLQYHIDKWEELTGLQLKDLTDLTLCYHIVINDLV
ncbi:helix-turn-helix domain-containing protein [Streptococcus anginosus]|uniref:Helix-turn-helix domain-containing protein n=2 Tax=Streptococcus TaxID=1301 RepID=A0AAU7PZ47_9STRE|nr:MULTISPECIES: helix-turn-helix domain-containing protein [Streptococcus]MBC5618533.1 helix-turn-helix domain-containing protein [Streptococcus hominis]MCW0924740.1 helix-turn-helix domain-containing protein [Streptococcus anginosus]PRT69080.1 regulator [Streptococcus anginosus]QOG24271.1 PucR family transcriptional regulator [Streptococcus sp. KS 6]VTS41936.1 leucine-rich protein [Streptococcus anginosus]